MMRDPNWKDAFLLAKELLAEAERRGITEEAMCKRLGVSSAYFSRWKRALRPAPDPRLKRSMDFYRSAAIFLNRPLGEVLAMAIFSEGETLEQLELLLLQDLSERLRVEMTFPSTSENEAKAREIFMNLAGRENYLPTLYASFKAYVSETLKERWFRSATEATILLARKEKDRKESEAFFGYTPESVRKELSASIHPYRRSAVG